MQGSPPFNLSPSDWTKLGVGALLAAAGALAGYATATVIPTLDAHAQNDWGSLIVALVSAVVPILLNFARKYLTDTRALRLVLLAVLLALPAASIAEEVAVIVDSAKPGTFLLTVSADGSISVNPIKVVRPGPAPTPQPPVPPVPPVLTPRATLLKTAAEKSTGLDTDRVNTAQGLSLILRELAKAAPTAKDPAALQAGVAMGLDGVLNHQNAQAAWKPFRDALSAQWAAVAVKGGSVADYGALLTEAADGCDASIPRPSVGTLKQIDPAFWAFLLQLLQIVLPLLIPK